MSRPADPQRRDTILQAATQMFLEKGYSETRLSDIAERAGIVTSTLYLYFHSKEEMVQAIAENLRRTLGRQLLPILENLRCRDDLEICVEKFMSFALEYNDLLKLWRLDSGLRGIPIFNIKSRRGPLFSQVMQLLEKRMDEGTLNRYDSALLIHIVVGFARWTFESVPLLEDEAERVHFRETCVNWLAHALFPYPAQLRD
ncbi:MAG TPA: TetR/AcrR family transcriptional regulator [Ktedonobacteraceae bacterium]|nr:TetR/AcrR family transcriptional regulator [Ktedonobacteraceae bacterium]